MQIPQSKLQNYRLIPIPTTKPTKRTDRIAMKHKKGCHLDYFDIRFHKLKVAATPIKRVSLCFSVHKMMVVKYAFYTF